MNRKICIENKVKKKSLRTFKFLTNQSMFKYKSKIWEKMSKLKNNNKVIA